MCILLLYCFLFSLADDNHLRRDTRKIVIVHDKIKLLYYYVSKRYINNSFVKC